MTNEELLEEMIDADGLTEVLRMLVTVCELKADHVLQYTDSKGLFDDWKTMAGRIGRVRVLV